MSFSAAAVFSNHCVLQQEKIIRIFGTAEKGFDKIISVTLCAKDGSVLCKNSAKAQDGRWEVLLSRQKAQEDCTLNITSDKKTLSFTDVAIGEVWLAGGQSNMEFELQNCTEGPDELKHTKNSRVRFYYTNKIAWKDNAFFEAEKNTSWQTWDSEWKKAWSAIGYFFAKKLSEQLNVTVGVIGCNWGGTSASAWMDRAHLEKDADLKTYLDEQEEATKGKSIEQQCAEYDRYTKENDEWQAKCNELYQTRPGIEWAEIQEILGPCQWPGPKSCKNPYRPTGLYECMLQRIMPYTLKGFIYYQGESDDHKPNSYYKLFRELIDQWRADWQDNSLPFLYVQLPEHRYKQDKDFKNWCIIREAQAKIQDTVKNAYMTCAADAGQYNDIHPKAKKLLAERMAKTALGTVYHLYKDSEVLSPRLAEAISFGSELSLYFENAPEGFVLKPDKQAENEYREMEGIQGNSVPPDFTGFELAGSDKVFYPAVPEFTTDNKNGIIKLKSDKVLYPQFARYAWYNYGPITVFTKSGLPLPPFRTDTENSVNEHAQIQQIMTV